MSKFIPHKKALTRSGFVRKYLAQITNVEFGNGNAATRVTLQNKSVGEGTCLGCSDAPCITYRPEEIAFIDKLESFPSDPSMDVCPKEAIFWDNKNTFVRVDNDLCISCGICVARCPYGAISLMNDGRCIIEVEDPSNITLSCDQETTYSHPRTERTGKICSTKSASAAKLISALVKLDESSYLLLIRNLFLSIGVKCNLRRKGDNNIRMDGILQFENKVGVLEIELGSSVLESPRALLEDLAVLKNRYQLALDEIIPVSLIFALPNLRSEYFQVIRDIEKVTKVRCRTLTLGSLIVLHWANKSNFNFDETNFNFIGGKNEIWDDLKKIVDIEEEIYPGAFKSSK